MTKIIYSTAILMTFIFSACSSKINPLQVNVEQGVIEGVMDNDLRVFKGVPFAAPPVGDLRWKAPQPAEKWSGVKLATKFAPAPMQGGEPSSGKSEDCLYLNIWTPAKSADEKLPVMVWIHGGGFSFGSSSDPMSDGANLARKGVIVVSVAYRVGQIGFLSHPELSAENPQGISGNYGLLDQIAGLAWIQQNIAAFGGDPKNVTIFGESAGGISVSMLCASPLAKGLFHAAISQSGGSFGPARSETYPGENMKTLAQAEQDGVKYVAELGLKSIKELREIEVEKLIPKGWTLPGGWPVIDGYVIPDDQFNLYQKGAFNDVPVLIGYNSDEGLSFSPGKTAEEYIANVNERFGPFTEELLKAYPLANDKVGRSARNLMRDAAFGWHTWSWARLQAEKGKSNVYYYYFDRHMEQPQDSPMADHGTPHGMDVPFVFMNIDKSNPFVSEEDIPFSEKIGTYWTNFAKYHNPNGEGLVEWPAFTNDNPLVLYLGSEISAEPVPDEASLNVLDRYFNWRRLEEKELENSKSTTH